METVGVHMHASDFLKGQLKHLVLEALHEKPLHGYALSGKIESLTLGVWKPTTGSLYPTLASLEREKLVSQSSTRVQGRKRNVYKLTQAGRKKFETEQHLIQAHEQQMLKYVHDVEGFSPGNMAELFFGFFAKMHEQAPEFQPLQGQFIRFILLHKEGKISSKKEKEFRHALVQFMQRVKKINDSV